MVELQLFKVRVQCTRLVSSGHRPGPSPVARGEGFAAMAFVPAMSRGTLLVCGAGVLALSGELGWLLSGPSRDSVAAVIAYSLLAATGLLSGFLSGLLGIGGALVVVPAMYLLLPLLGVPTEGVPHAAVGSSLIAMVPSSLAAGVAQYRRRGLDLAWLTRLAPGMMFGAAVGAAFAMQLRGPVLSLLFASQSFYYGWGLLCSGAPGSVSWRARILDGCRRCPGWLTGPSVAAFCACAGMGGGSLTVPWLVTKGLTLLRASATSSALNLCIALGGGLVMASLTHGGGSAAVCWPAALIVGGGAVLSVSHGVAVAHRMPVALFRRLLGAVTLFGATVLTARTVFVFA